MDFTWNVNSPISLVALDTLQNNEGDVVSLHIKAQDATSGATLTFTALGLPDGLTISSSGLVSGTIAVGTADSGGSYAPTINVTDGTAVASEGFTWNVNSPISLVAIDTLQNNEGDVVSFHVKASDSTSGATLSYAQTGLPNGLSLNASSGLISGTIAAGTGNAETFAPQITVNDGTAVASMGFTWNINSPISLVAIDTLQNNEGDVVSFHIKASDSTSGATLSYAQTGLPNGLSLNSSTGLITGTIAAGTGNAEVFSPTITVTDGTAVASEEFTWNVNSPITLVPIDTLQNNEGDVVSFHIKASDATSGATLSYAQTGLPNGLSLNSSTGLISGTIAAGSADGGGAFAPTITVTDGTAVVSEGFTWNVNSPITLVAINTLQNNEGEIVSFHVKASDATSGATLSYAQTGLPNGLSLNSSTGLISGTIAAGSADGGGFAPTITVTDGTAVASEGFTWNINSPITLVAIGTLQNNEGDIVSFHVKASDSTSGATLSYAQTGLPNGLSLNSSSGLISGTIAAGTGDSGGVYSPTSTVTDGTAVASESFSWNVNSPISLVPIDTLQNNEGDVVSFHVKASDSTSGATLSYAQTGLPNGLSLNSSTGLISGTIAAGSADGGGAFAPTITVSDGTAVASEGFTWNINSPITLAAVANQQSSEGAVVSLSLHASDATSGATLSWSAAGLPDGLALNASTGLISGTIAAGAANAGPASPIITVTDGTAVASEGFTWNLESAITIDGINTQRTSEGSSVSLSVSATDANSLSMTFSAAGLPDGVTINPSTGLISGTVAAGAANAGMATEPTIMVTDGTAVASESFSWNVVSPISIGGLFTQQSSEGSSVSLSVVASDSNSMSLSYSAQDLPAGLSINASTGLISGTIAAGAANAGPALPVVTVTDGTAVASDSFTWNVASAISLSFIPTQTTAEGSSVSLSLSATDANSLSLSWSASGLPAGLSINASSGLISGTVAAGAANAGDASPVITVTDGTSETSDSFTWDLESAVSLGSIATQTTAEGSSVSLSLSATDANSLSLSWSANGLPAGLTMNATTGLISGTLAAGAANTGSLTPIVTVTDGTSEASESFTWNLESAISLGTLSNIVDTVGSSVSVGVSATDSNSLSLTYSASDLPEGVSINPTSGLITGTVIAGSAGDSSLTPIITVSDGTSEASESFTWNIGPVTQDGSYNTQENTSLSVAASAGVLSLDTAPAGTTLTATLLTGTVDGSLSLATNGSFVYIPDSGWVGTDSFTYEASDGSVDSAPVTVTIQTDLTVSSTNYVAVATGDFTGDGNTDVVAVNESGNDVAIYLGNGDGTFQTSPTTISVGNGPDAVVVGAFGNGAEDIAVANGTDGTVTILLNNGSGSFTVSQTLTVGSDPVALALGDFEGNDYLDLAVVNKGSNSVSVFLNNGSGTFTLDTTLTVNTAPTSVAAADLNGAGYDDLVVTNSGSNNIYVFLSHGDGTFGSPANYSVGTSPSAVVAADFTDSGIMDVAVANAGSDTVSVLLGNGNGTLGTPTNYAVGTTPVALAAADIAGTGFMDLAVVNNGSNNETILTNNGEGGVTPESQLIGLETSPTAFVTFSQGSNEEEIVDGAQGVIKFLADNLSRITLIAPGGLGYTVTLPQGGFLVIGADSSDNTIKAVVGVLKTKDPLVTIPGFSDIQVADGNPSYAIQTLGKELIGQTTFYMVSSNPPISFTGFGIVGGFRFQLAAVAAGPFQWKRYAYGVQTTTIPGNAPATTITELMADGSGTIMKGGAITDVPFEYSILPEPPKVETSAGNKPVVTFSWANKEKLATAEADFWKKLVGTVVTVKSFAVYFYNNNQNAPFGVLLYSETITLSPANHYQSTMGDVYWVRLG
jgi:hypothetical protein